LGFGLSIDDFGTGYSSLAYLKKLPVHELKIDRSFVMNLDRDEADACIVRSTIDLAHNMGLRVVAEGVETESVAGRLRALGCDQAQGYLFSRPLSAEDYFDWATAPAAVAESYTAEFETQAA
jgi:EAL domain-containing protein (putative c-di-GMP-specific phosphodiesterase class I)